MFKKFLGTILVFLMLTTAAFGCVLSSGATVYVYSTQVQGFMGPISVPSDQIVEIHPDQPSAEQLKAFGEHPSVGADWSDGVIIIDEDDNAIVLVHRKDLKDCN